MINQINGIKPFQIKLTNPHQVNGISLPQILLLNQIPIINHNNQVIEKLFNILLLKNLRNPNQLLEPCSNKLVESIVFLNRWET